MFDLIPAAWRPDRKMVAAGGITAAAAVTVVLARNLLGIELDAEAVAAGMAALAALAAYLVPSAAADVERAVERHFDLVLDIFGLEQVDADDDDDGAIDPADQAAFDPAGNRSATPES